MNSSFSPESFIVSQANFVSENSLQRTSGGKLCAAVLRSELSILLWMSLLVDLPESHPKLALSLSLPFTSPLFLPLASHKASPFLAFPSPFKLYLSEVAALCLKTLF